MSDGPGIVLLLAAGQSRRFGSDKRLHALNDGEALAVQTARAYLSAGLAVLPVIRPEDADGLGALFIEAGTLPPVESARASSGMGYSLADAADYLLSSDIADSPVIRGAKSAGILIALADMPFVQPDTIKALATHGDGAFNIVAPQRSNTDDGRPAQMGHPVRFPWALLAELSKLTGDTGARSLFARFPERLLTLSTEDDGVALDVDYPPA